MLLILCISPLFRCKVTNNPTSDPRFLEKFHHFSLSKKELKDVYQFFARQLFKRPLSLQVT